MGIFKEVILSSAKQFLLQATVVDTDLRVIQKLINVRRLELRMSLAFMRYTF